MEVREETQPDDSGKVEMVKGIIEQNMIVRAAKYDFGSGSDAAVSQRTCRQNNGANFFFLEIFEIYMEDWK